jgi:hypothetical protein
MKITLIIIALMCTDHEQGYFCYKAVKKHSSEEAKQIPQKDMICDTFTLYTHQPLTAGQEIQIPTDK